MSRIAVIPARGGSKRIPRKNIKHFAGKPMIAWSIDAAIQCGLFDRIIVSTDDDEIAEIARTLGAEVPFMRPAYLSDDHTATIPVIAHAIDALIDEGEAPVDVCCIYATAPFISADDLEASYKQFKRTDSMYCFTATEFAAPIFRSFQVEDDHSVEMFWPENFEKRSQDLPVAYHDAGQFYWGHAKAWMDGDLIFAPHSQAFVIPRWRVQDIDTPDDWARAELMAPAILG
ncbi:MAG TPA: pseudaminic acid cytidylyltransferase [Oceanospirillales bacterium]|jgi:pseudaminic acid cytidylyltransferase|nr:pseudaminic acid cytidylyltransferase [Pseudomonadota bacterium]MED5441382.1 pseudaminic acid cytidylyltransferase [Pseudomonadota bacterium]MEE3160658.1 pseudaminic acid cytidylyltransferase [Pseudomonadota bacterium]MEE3210444.1 pseudaminic acid cytidylyltransferase [Pseudomonadota bacterium]HCG79137.1 pseudaminic acid cytidylyltransferase [Oceanospirillales bacterium]|tara:strand:- start:1407 stop:2096 length:690 start_codon:yes stop_codon:yes gene_type:complete